MLRLAFDFIITWRETRTRPNAYGVEYNEQENEEEDFKSVHASISLYIFNISLAVFSHENRRTLSSPYAVCD